jgi:peptidyl-prolyl cis-trans isomerase D
MAIDTEPRKLLSYGFIFLIALVFTLQFGPGSRGCEATTDSSPLAAATVNGKEIPTKEFSRAYGMQLEAYRAQRMPVNEELAKQLGIPRQVLDQLVNQELLAQEAERRGIGTSDAEVLEELKKNESFHKDGAFNFEHYREVLADFLKKTPQEFEDDLRRRLAAGKLSELVESGAQVSDDEVRSRFFREQNTADLTYVRFLPTMYAAKVPAPKPADLDAYKKAHATQIAEYYEKNKVNYHQSEQIKARQILLKAPKDAPEAKRTDAKTKLENVRKEIEGGKDFAELAKAVTEDVGTRASGGELGWVERLSLPNEVAAAAFTINAGELTQVVESPLGFHLIKVEEKRPPATKELKDVEADIARQLLIKEKATALAKADADKALAAAKAGTKLATKYPPEKEGQPAVLRYETETRPEAVTTGSFASSAAQVPHLGVAPELQKEVFALTSAKSLDKVFTVGEALVVAEVTERKLPKEEDFKAQLDTLRSEAIWARQGELRDSFLKALRKEAKVTTNDDLVGAPVERS